MLDQCLREHKPAFFAERLKNTVENYIKQSICNQPDFEKFSKALEPFYDDFRNSALDKSVDDNIRWAMANKFISRSLERCSLEYLEQYLLKYFK
jgi:hypothetical protein